MPGLLTKRRELFTITLKNREEIIKEVLRYEADLLHEAINEAIDSEKDPDKKLYSFFFIRAKQIFVLWSFYQSVIAEYFNR